MSGFIGGSGSGSGSALDARAFINDTCTSGSRPVGVTSTLSYSSTNNSISGASGVSTGYSNTGYSLKRLMCFEFDMMVSESGNTCNIYIQKGGSATVGIFSWQSDGTAVMYKSDGASFVGSGFTPILNRVYRIKVTFGVGTEGTVTVMDQTGALIYSGIYVNLITLASGDTLNVALNSNKAISVFRVKQYDASV